MMLTMAAKKKRGRGIDIPEAQRHTVQVKLRFPPEVAEALEEVAERWGVTKSGAVARMLEKERGEE